MVSLKCFCLTIEPATTPIGIGQELPTADLRGTVSPWKIVKTVRYQRLGVSLGALSFWGNIKGIKPAHDHIYGYGSIPTLNRGMTIHLPAFLKFTRGADF
jgi:hypothetical protein